MSADVRFSGPPHLLALIWASYAFAVGRVSGKVFEKNHWLSIVVALAMQWFWSPRRWRSRGGPPGCGGHATLVDLGRLCDPRVSKNLRSGHHTWSLAWRSGGGAPTTCGISAMFTNS